MAVRRLNEHNVHIPTKAELAAEPAAEVRRLAQESMNAARPPGMTPLEDLYEGEDES